MDYKYINQLLDRYWKAETSLEEEEILRAFFSQDELPAELKPYQALFSYEMGEAKQEAPGDDFDQKMMALIDRSARFQTAEVATSGWPSFLHRAAA